MTNLENLRKQAKQFVRWHRERRWTVAQVIREHLPRYQALSDGQILSADFKLADAQELVAVRAGFDTWHALVASCERPPEPDCQVVGDEQRPRVLIAKPFVFVRDVRAACAYYVGKLGFVVAFEYGNPPFYAEVERNGVRLCLRHTDEPVIDPALAKREHLFAVSFEVSDAKAMFLELQHSGAMLSRPLHAEPYGTREFTVTDVDGNHIHFFDLARHPKGRDAVVAAVDQR